MSAREEWRRAWRDARCARRGVLAVPGWPPFSWARRLALLPARMHIAVCHALGVRMMDAGERWTEYAEEVHTVWLGRRRLLLLKRERHQRRGQRQRGHDLAWKDEQQDARIGAERRRLAQG